MPGARHFSRSPAESGGNRDDGNLRIPNLRGCIPNQPRQSARVTQVPVTDLFQRVVCFSIRNVSKNHNHSAQNAILKQWRDGCMKRANDCRLCARTYLLLCGRCGHGGLRRELDNLRRDLAFRLPLYGVSSRADIDQSTPLHPARPD